jgi:hypothetical protein
MNAAEIKGIGTTLGIGEEEGRRLVFSGHGRERLN